MIIYNIYNIVFLFLYKEHLVELLVQVCLLLLCIYIYMIDCFILYCSALITLIGSISELMGIISVIQLQKMVMVSDINFIFMSTNIP